MKRTAFKIPLQSEVVVYIKEKKGWPEEFCKYYAERFWNYYQSSGWKLSSGNLIKDWKACFNSQWQVLKFKEDIDFFNKCQGVKKINGEPQNDFERLDLVIERYKLRPLEFGFQKFGQYYDFMKAHKLLGLTKEKGEELLRIYEGDKEKCRCAAVQIAFTGFVDSGMKVSEIMEIRKRLNDRS